jgi:hypothetical protein
MHSYQKVKYSYINDNFMKSIKNITKGIIKIHYTCLNSDGTGDLSLLRYKPDFVISLFVINELYCSEII